MEFIQRDIGLFGWATGGISRAQATVFRGLLEQFGTGEYEEVEARAKALADRPRRVFWNRSPEPVWMARTFALTAAVLHGRREHVLPELEALTEALQQTSGSGRKPFCWWFGSIARSFSSVRSGTRTRSPRPPASCVR
ncbi:hypothetical protein ACFVHS_32225 [Streptomyces sp. NPDC057746]|uniref:hypothetical protein n=1 Tax=unclassified Streptomyces TaxID=2593676 RepID=UPI0033A35EC7